MPRDDHYTFHRKWPGRDEDRLIGEGTKDEMLDRYEAMPQALRSQSFMMLGGMKFNHLEIDNLLREREEER
jgi:hypothetical protein